MADDAPRTSNVGAARRGRRFALAVAGGLVALTLLLVVLMQFDFIDAGFHAPFAMTLGVVFTALLGAGLMALSFYSSKAGYDDAARGMGADDRTFTDPADD